MASAVLRDRVAADSSTRTILRVVLTHGVKVRYWVRSRLGATFSIRTSPDGQDAGMSALVTGPIAPAGTMVTGTFDGPGGHLIVQYSGSNPGQVDDVIVGLMETEP